MRRIEILVPRGFVRAARGVFTEQQLTAVKRKLASNPELGDMIPGAGGARKVRQLGIGGQSRVIYYYHAGRAAIVLLTCYPKNRKRDLTEGERCDLRNAIKAIKESMGVRQ